MAKNKKEKAGGGEPQPGEQGGQQGHGGENPPAPSPKAAKEPRMIEYEVLRECHGFEGRRWHRGQRIKRPEGVEVPHHFHDVTKPKPKDANDPRRAINAKKVRRLVSTTVSE